MLSLIVNSSAGDGRAGRALPEVQDALSGHGLDHHVERTDSLEHARELALAAAAGGETTVAMGGDGLIAAVADALKHSDGVLGILPGGRGNDFARVLGIPRKPRAACGVIASGEVRELDLGQAGETTFIGIASCGFDSEANRIANETRLVMGNLVYAYGALRALMSWQPATFEIVLDRDRRHVVTGYSVGAANNKAYGGGMYAAPDAELDDGLLDVVTCANMRKTRFLTALLPRIFKGTHVELPEVTVLRAAQVEIAADRPLTLYADGDPIGELPVTVRVLPRAVRVIVPKSR